MAILVAVRMALLVGEIYVATRVATRLALLVGEIYVTTRVATKVTTLLTQKTCEKLYLDGVN